MESAARAPVARLDWLDYLRLVCALCVLFYHYMVVGLDPRVSHGITDFGLATAIARFGPLCVLIFLMISGLVITLAAERQTASTYVARRLARLYPTFLLCMTFTALFGWLGPERHHVGIAQYAANLPVYAPGFGYRYVDAVYWSLVIEFVFYGAVAVAMLLGWIKRLQLAVAVWIALQLLLSPLPWRMPLFGVDYYFLGAGAVFALYYQRRNARLNLALLAVSLGLCIRCAVVYAHDFSFNAWGAAGLTVAAFGLFLFMRGRNFRLPLAKRIGSLTYALYLLHFVVGLILMRWWIDESNKWLVVIGLTALMISAAALVDEVMEFRLRPLWIRIARATVARPLEWIEARTSRAK